MKIWRKARKILGIVAVLFVIAGYCVVKVYPRIFNESFFEHAHCIAIANGMFMEYAKDHDGHFPYNTNGYGDALLVMVAEDPNYSIFLTGPCYDENPFLKALKTGGHLSESNCGRVYVQGLTVSNDERVAILFDKVPTPGGDHCHMLDRFKMPLGREVVTIGGTTYVEESNWPAFSHEQVELLVQAGIPRARAAGLYGLPAR